SDLGSGDPSPFMESQSTSRPIGLEPVVQAILAKAHAAQTQIAVDCRAQAQAEARFRRAHDAWLRVSTFEGDRIPRELTGESLRHYRAMLLGQLGHVLKTDGWQDQVDAVSPGSEAKTYALAILKRAMDGDLATVEFMLQGVLDTLCSMGLRADSWIRDGLRYE